jgi:hypothetical protein
MSPDEIRRWASDAAKQLEKQVRTSIEENIRQELQSARKDADDLISTGLDEEDRRLSLERQMWQRARAEIEGQINADRGDLEREVRAAIFEELHQKLRIQDHFIIRQTVFDELRRELLESELDTVRGEARAQLRCVLTTLLPNVIEAVRTEIYEEIIDEIVDDIKTELRSELEDEVREEMREALISQLSARIGTE